MRFMKTLKSICLANKRNNLKHRKSSSNSIQILIGIHSVKHQKSTKRQGRSNNNLLRLLIKQQKIEAIRSSGKKNLKNMNLGDNIIRKENSPETMISIPALKQKIFKQELKTTILIQLPYINIYLERKLMIDDNPFAPRSVTCLIHRKEKATHICTEYACQQNPFFCGLCFNDTRWRSQHPHESSIKPLNDGIQLLTSAIRTQAKSIELVYQRTIGNRQSQLIKFNLQKGVLFNEELDNRLDNLRIQLELQLELLMKEFQKQIQLEKQEFVRRLDEYKRTFYHNLDVIKRECMELLTYQNSLKYYNNFNSFTLKLIHQTQKRSQDWLIQQKKVLLKVSQVLESPSFSTNVNLMLNRVNKSNLLVIPSWKVEKRDNQTQRDIHTCIRNAVNNWIELPEPIDLDQMRPNEYSSSNKFIPYPVSV